MLPEEGVVIITDDNVLDLYGESYPDVPCYSIPPGEESKRLEIVGDLAGKLLETGTDRSGFVLAIGGGVVCDLAGFLASVYMRGIRCGYVSTTFLSQVDASTGGKNGVNLGGTKNILGNIRQPEFVICDPAMLHTLPEEEYLSGLAELIKTAIIGDRELFEMIEDNHSRIMQREDDLLTEMVTRAVRFKASIVSQDERESGLRRVLNFGHTYGHAVEMLSSVRHGFAVAKGMEMAARFSSERGLIDDDERKRIIDLLRRFRLIKDHSFTDDQITALIQRDKKRTGNDIHFVFAHGIGNAVIKRLSVDEVIAFYKRYRT
jgi:3-dehydroquinate synthase